MPEQVKRSFSWSQVSAFRLRRHHFIDQGEADLATVSQHVCGIQAQVLSAAEMALWARMHYLTQADIHSALWESRSLVKTSCMRGTLHLIAATDLPIYISALRRSRSELLRRLTSKQGMTQNEDDRALLAVTEALGAGPMTRRELAERVGSAEGEKVKTSIERPWGVVRRAVIEGAVCYGPSRGQEATFVRTDQWLPEWSEVSEQEAKQVLLRRYLSAYGPASLQDFSKWSGMSMKEVRPVRESLDDALVEVSIEGQQALTLREDCDQLVSRDISDQVLRLLPNFDPYLLGHVETSHLVDAKHYKRVYRKAGWISPVVLLNGRVIGTWSNTRRGNRFYFEIEPFESLSKALRTKVEEEAASLGGFLGAPWELKFSK